MRQYRWPIVVFIVLTVLTNWLFALAVAACWVGVASPLYEYTGGDDPGKHLSRMYRHPK